MANRQLRQCAKAGCKTLVYRGYCELHKPKSYHTTRNAYYHLYNNSRWKKYRVIYLSENPFCVTCGGRSSLVDHIKDHKGDLNMFWDENNHQAMCKRCHDRKTGREQQNFRPPHIVTNLDIHS